MIKKRRQSGFSLTEVLLAVVTLAIGMLFVGGTFVLGVHFSRLSTEQSIGAVVAEEAFAKLRLYDVNSVEMNTMHGPLYLQDANNIEYTYPSDEKVLTRQYQWSAIGRRLEGTNLVQITVFVMRTPSAVLLQPRPITASWDPDTSKWRVTDPNIMDGMKMVHDQSGLIRRVSVAPSDPLGTLEPLPGEFTGADSTWWMVDPVEGEGRNPGVGIFQKLMYITSDGETSGGQR